MSTLVEDACRFWKIFDVAYTFFFIKLWKMHPKFYMRCKMTAAWKFLEKFSMHFPKNLCIFYVTYKTFCKWGGGCCRKGVDY